MNHADCGEWRRVSPCVYCACGQRLYNGTLPKNDEQKRETAAFLESLPALMEKRAKPQGDTE